MGAKVASIRGGCRPVVSDCCPKGVYLSGCAIQFVLPSVESGYQTILFLSPLLFPGYEIPGELGHFVSKCLVLGTECSELSPAVLKCCVFRMWVC